MRCSNVGEGFIKGFELCRLKAYKDSGGVWTIGWGQTYQGLKEGDTCTQEQANRMFEEHLETQVVGPLNNLIKVTLNQNQFDALCSLTYNIGIGNFQYSTLLHLLNSNDFLGAANQILVWNKVNKKESQGLDKRRLAERALFNTPIGV